MFFLLYRGKSLDYLGKDAPYFSPLSPSFPSTKNLGIYLLLSSPKHNDPSVAPLCRPSVHRVLFVTIWNPSF